MEDIIFSLTAVEEAATLVRSKVRTCVTKISRKVKTLSQKNTFLIFSANPNRNKKKKNVHTNNKLTYLSTSLMWFLNKIDDRFISH